MNKLLIFETLVVMLVIVIFKACILGSETDKFNENFISKIDKLASDDNHEQIAKEMLSYLYRSGLTHCRTTFWFDSMSTEVYVAQLVSILNTIIHFDNSAALYKSEFLVMQSNMLRDLVKDKPFMLEHRINYWKLTVLSFIILLIVSTITVCITKDISKNLDTIDV